MAELALDMLEYLKSKGMVTELGGDAFRDFMPDKPTRCVAIHETSSSLPSFHDAAIMRHFQVEVRMQNKASARSFCWAIFGLFDVEDNQIQLTPERICCVRPKNPPILLKKDDQGRHYYTFNLIAVSVKDYV